MSGPYADRSAEQLLSEARHELARLRAENERLRKVYCPTCEGVGRGDREHALVTDRDAWRDLVAGFSRLAGDYFEGPIGMDEGELRTLLDRARARLKETDR